MSNLKLFKQSVLAQFAQYGWTEQTTYFCQTRDGYYADYRPKYPEKTAADATVFEDALTRERTLYGNLQSAICTRISLGGPKPKISARDK